MRKLFTLFFVVSCLVATAVSQTRTPLRTKKSTTITASPGESKTLRLAAQTRNEISFRIDGDSEGAQILVRAMEGGETSLRSEIICYVKTEQGRLLFGVPYEGINPHTATRVLSSGTHLTQGEIITLKFEQDDIFFKLPLNITFEVNNPGTETVGVEVFERRAMPTTRTLAATTTAMVEANAIGSTCQTIKLQSADFFKAKVLNSEIEGRAFFPGPYITGGLGLRQLGQNPLLDWQVLNGSPIPGFVENEPGRLAARQFLALQLSFVEVGMPIGGFLYTAITPKASFACYGVNIQITLSTGFKIDQHTTLADLERQFRAAFYEYRYKFSPERYNDLRILGEVTDDLIKNAK